MYFSVFFLEITYHRTVSISKNKTMNTGVCKPTRLINSHHFLIFTICLESEPSISKANAAPVDVGSHFLSVCHLADSLDLCSFASTFLSYKVLG